MAAIGPIKSAENDDSSDEHFKLPRRLKRFRKFASVEFDGEIFMTPQDFLDSLTLDEPSERVFRTVLSEHQVRKMVGLTPPLRKGTHKMFRALGDNGIISYAEYLFLITLLTKSHDSFNVAFLMFDEDDNFQIDKEEFFKIQFLITSGARPSATGVSREVFDQNGNECVVNSDFASPFVPVGGFFQSLTDEKQRFEHLISSNVAFIRTRAERLKKDSSRNSKLAIYPAIMEEATEAMRKRETTITIHLFGRRGQNTLSFDEFQSFYHRLQREIIEIEFKEFSRGKDRISTVDFARLVLRYSLLHREEQSPYIRRAYERSEYNEEGITLQQFEQFSMFLNNLEDFSKAVRLYSLADIPVSQSEFIRAVKCSTGFSLDSGLVSVLYKIFDANADDKLSYREFIAVMSDRLSRGHKTQRTEQRKLHSDLATVLGQMPRDHQQGAGSACRPEDFARLGFSSICHYVQNHSEACDGGGYLHWTEYALCSSSSSSSSSEGGGSLSHVLVLFCSVLFFLLLFIHLSITADSFCKNIAAIVDLHGISQNIAGVTFMAFGNGASDIFSSIASVISAKRPRADLAISELLGGGIFVTTCVIALIAFSRPFHLMRRPILRDIFFYLLALALLVFVSYSSHTMQLWHPCAFLLLYLVYAAFVVLSNLFRQQMRPLERRRRMRKTIGRFSLLVPPRTSKVAPIADEKGPKGMELDERAIAGGEGKQKAGRFIVTPQSMQIEASVGRRDSSPPFPSRMIAVIALPTGVLIVPTQLNQRQNQSQNDAESSAKAFLEAGRFFAKEELDELSGDEGTEEFTPAEGGNTPSSPSCTPSSIDGCRVNESVGNWAEARRLVSEFCSLDGHRLRRSAWPTQLFLIARIPSLLLLRLTIPSATRCWSKPISTIHAFMAPLVFCATFQCLKRPLPGFPSFVVGELALLLSVLLALFVLFCTQMHREPPCYKRCAAYIGFGISIAWIYATASEVMNVVLMFGTISGIPHQILGLTAIAWANSIGDLIADITVARQGMSRMAFSAAIGAPLFNLMVGFGTTFMIAELQGKVVIIEPDPVALVMFVFLTLSLLSTLLLLLFQKFFVRRLHGFVLVALYAAFLVVAIMASQRTLFVSSSSAD
uniref:Sodium/calcium exchanger membrane region domain-containing protein n=1 Tax=Globodera rostochiensis TaxID=31243 RepID=A0A914GXM7_GLORO